RPWQVGGMWLRASAASRRAAAEDGRASWVDALGTLRVMLWAPARWVWVAGTSQSSRPPIDVTQTPSGRRRLFRSAMNFESSDIWAIDVARGSSWFGSATWTA